MVKGLACMTSNRHSYPSGQNVFRYLMITLFFPKKIVYPIVAEIFMSSDGEISRYNSHYRAYIAEQSAESDGGNNSMPNSYTVLFAFFLYSYKIVCHSDHML